MRGLMGESTGVGVAVMDAVMEAVIDLVPASVSATHPSMTITLTKEAKAQAITSLERYFLENLADHADDHLGGKLGNIAAGALLNFFLEEVGPLVYNQAVAEVQERLQQRVSEIDIELHEDEFQYWRKFDVKAGPKTKGG